MFREHNNVVWGTYCSCGNECSIIQNQHHPWVDSTFSVQMKCASCGNRVVINQNSARKFYNEKVYSFFTGLNGTVIDFGCGDGFLSRYLLSQDDIDTIYGVDVDSESMEQTRDILSHKFTFKKYDGCNLNNIFLPNSVDYLVSRDVFMFISDYNRYFCDVNLIVKKGIRQMGWYKKSDSRIKNQLEPQQIAQKYQDMGWHVHLEELDWYKSSYSISADKD